MKQLLQMYVTFGECLLSCGTTNWVKEKPQQSVKETIPDIHRDPDVMKIQITLTLSNNLNVT